MKMTIIGEPVAIAEIYPEGIKKELARHWDLENAIKNNSKLIKNNTKTKTESELKEWLWICLDWGSLLDAFTKGSMPKIVARYFIVEYSGWVRLYPGRHIKKREFEFMEERKEGYALLVTQSLIRNPNVDIKSLIKSLQFIYGDEDKVGWVEEK